MNDIVFTLAGTPVTLAHLLLAFAALVVVAWLASRGGRSRAADEAAALAAAASSAEIEARMGEVARANAELAGRVRAMTEMLGDRQSDLGRLLAERLDAVGLRVGQGLEVSGRTTADTLGKLGERLAVIDAAQARLVGLTQEVVGLKDILANKQARGAFGQGRMEAIVRDGLPESAFEFQPTLSNRNRPDCAIRLPGDARRMIVDAKFPLEAFAALRDASDDDARRIAGQRVRQDILKHVRDIAERYFVPGETQDVALLFVPSESVFADLQEHFEDVVQRAHRARVVVVSPSLLMMAIQLLQTLTRDARMRDEAHLIQAEVGKLLADVRRLGERVGKLDDHFRMAQKDVVEIVTSAGKIVGRAERVEAMDLADDPPQRLRAAE